MGSQAGAVRGQDDDPATRRTLGDRFARADIAFSIDTGPARLVRRMSGAPQIRCFVHRAGAQAANVFLQDVGCQTDRHWASGEGEDALGDCTSALHLALEPHRTSHTRTGFADKKTSGLADWFANAS